MYRLAIEMPLAYLRQAEAIFDNLMVGHTIIIKDEHTMVTFTDTVAIKDPYSRIIITSVGRILPLSKMHLIVKITGHTLEIPISAFCNQVIRELYPHLKLPAENFKTVSYSLIPEADKTNLKKVTFEEVDFGDEILDPTIMNGDQNLGIIAFIDRHNGFFATADNHHFSKDNCGHLLFTGRHKVPFYASEALQHFLDQNYS